MPRLYTVGFKNVTVSAAQDLVAVKGSTGKVCKVLRAWLGMNDTTLETAQGLRLNIKYAPATLTLGSGGSTPTPRPTDPGDSAFSGTAHANDTVQATTSGSFVDFCSWGGHNYGIPPQNFGDAGPEFGLNEGVVFELLSSVSGTCNFSGGLLIWERGS